MATVALKKTESTATDAGNKSNAIFAVVSIDNICRESDGSTKANVITAVWSTRASFDNCDAPHTTAGVNHRYNITIPSGELTMTAVHAEVKAGMEAEGFTITNEV